MIVTVTLVSGTVAEYEDVEEIIHNDWGAEIIHSRGVVTIPGARIELLESWSEDDDDA